MFCNKKYKQLKKDYEKLKNENGNLLEKNNGLKKEKGDLKNTLDKICSTLNSQTALESKPKKLSKQPKFFKFLINENSFHPKLTTRFNIIIIIIMLIIYLFTGYYITSESKYASFIYAIVSSIISLLFVNYISPLFRDFVYKKRKADFYNEKALFVKQFDMNYSQDLSYVRTNSTTFIIICNIFLLFLLITTSNEQNQKKDIIIKDSKVNITCDKHKNQCKLDSKNDIDVAPSKD